MSEAKATCSAHGSHFDKLSATPAGWLHESDLSDFHELRQGFIPPSLANHILAAKGANPKGQTDTSALEKEIDHA